MVSDNCLSHKVESLSLTCARRRLITLGREIKDLASGLEVSFEHINRTTNGVEDFFAKKWSWRAVLWNFSFTRRIALIVIVE